MLQGPLRKPRRGRSRICVGAWAALLLVGSLFPGASGPVSVFLFPGCDKLLHVVAYAVLCALIVWAAAGRAWWVRMVGAGLAAVLFGLAMELLQPLVGRGFEYEDLAANAVGAACGLLVAAVTARRLRRRAGAAG